MKKHIIFFDAECPLCQRAIRTLLQIDRESKFLFAPLKGKTAKRELSQLKLAHPNLDTLVLLQNYGKEDEKILIEGKAILRICWILGREYAPLGILSFFPSPLFDWMYRIVAKNRYKIFKSKEKIETSQFVNRFLP